MFKSGPNNRGVAEVKDIMATGKRSQFARLVCEPLLLIFSVVTGTYWILQKDLVLEIFVDIGQEVMLTGTIGN